MKLPLCPICKAPVKRRGEPSVRRSHIECHRCAEYSGDDDALRALERTGWSDLQVANASGHIRRNAGLQITNEQVEHLSVLPTPAVGEKAARLLSALGREYPQTGESFSAPVWEVQKALKAIPALQSFGDAAKSDSGYTSLPALKWLAVASASSAEELQWLIYDCLDAQGFLTKGAADGTCVVTLHGWQEIERLKQVNVASRIGFVAMSFRDEFIPLYDHGIARGIDAAGYEPRRVDRTEHNNRIDDEIIASIKQSRFLVADFTVDRGGIYFEAGYAMGLRLEVIWLVREDQIDAVHFDNRQYNFIKWQEGAWDDLAERLRFRIERTIGRGPISPSLRS